MSLARRSLRITRSLPLALATLSCAEPVAQPSASRELAPYEALETAIPFRQVSAGCSHTCGVTDLGEAWCWGSNDEGELGTGTTISRTVRFEFAADTGSNRSAPAATTSAG